MHWGSPPSLTPHVLLPIHPLPCEATDEGHAEAYVQDDSPGKLMTNWPGCCTARMKGILFCCRRWGEMRVSCDPCTGVRGWAQADSESLSALQARS